MSAIDDSPTLTVVADLDLCDGYGECVKAAPDHFELDDDGFVVVTDENVTEEAEGRVIAAVTRCPKSALTLLADGKPVDLP
ncbi:ferredoxin [Gordonia hydrophobica]|uniref:Ferredoxin n=1 Tax=Gordonia hydrophobica TaxID=40516 RepID=A0ABZ2TVF1_9ACTN|nr:ferredoxin [Gordonia hydrophobica]MBM7366062.1 ferredoxin [Gordonia hydrophobica]